MYEDLDFSVEVSFLPPTSILQLTNYGTIVVFKSYFLRRTVGELIRGIDSDKRSIKDRWKFFIIMEVTRDINFQG